MYMEASSVNKTLSNPLDILREDISELKVPFDTVRHEISSKLRKGSERMDTTEKLYQAATEMTKTLGEKYTNASNEQNDWKDIKIKLAKTSLKGRVILNVGGTKYTTSIDTLTREKNTFFTELFSQESELILDDVDKSIFIDRNGDTFMYILEYLRTDVVSDDVLSDELLLHNLMIEANYFRLQSLRIILTTAEKQIIEEAKRQREEEERFRSINSFENGTLLELQQKTKLNEFYGKPNQRWQLIYKASRDGFDANSFHTRCDKQGPTMTIIRSNNNYLFGGYTAVPWSSDGVYKSDTTAFLYTLTNPHNISPTKYTVKPANSGLAVYPNNSYGPTFGSGHDLHIANNSTSNNSSYTNFPHGYNDTTGKGNTTFTGALNFTATDIEVFKQV